MTIAQAKLIGFNYPGVGPEGYVRIQQSAWAEAEQLFADLVDGGLTDNLVYGAAAISIDQTWNVPVGQPMVTLVTAVVADVEVRLPPNNVAGVTVGKPYQFQNVGSNNFVVADSAGNVLVPVVRPGDMVTAAPAGNATAIDPWAVAVWGRRATMLEASAGTGPGVMTAELTAAAISAQSPQPVLNDGAAFFANSGSFDRNLPLNDGAEFIDYEIKGGGGKAGDAPGTGDNESCSAGGGEAGTVRGRFPVSLLGALTSVTIGNSMQATSLGSVATALPGAVGEARSSGTSVKNPGARGGQGGSGSGSGSNVFLQIIQGARGHDVPLGGDPLGSGGAGGGKGGGRGAWVNSNDGQAGANNSGGGGGGRFNGVYQGAANGYSGGSGYALIWWKGLT